MKKFLIGLANFIIIPILFGCISFLIVSFGIEKAFSYKNIEKAVQNTIQENVSKEESTILDPIYEKGEQYHFTKEEMDEILENDTVQNLLSEYVYYNLKGEEFKLTDTEINDVLDVAVDTKVKGNDILSEVEKEAIKLYMREHFNEVQTIRVKNEANGETETLQELLNKVSSKEVRVKIFVIAFVTILLVVFLNLSKFLWLKEITRTLLSAGGTLFLLSFLIKPLVSSYADAMVANIVVDILTPIKVYGLLVFIVGAIGITLYFILKKRITKKQQVTNPEV